MLILLLQIEGLIDEIDFRLQVTREEFENLNKDLFDRVKLPVENALKTSGLTLDVINQVIFRYISLHANLPDFVNDKTHLLCV